MQMARKRSPSASTRNGGNGKGKGAESAGGGAAAGTGVVSGFSRRLTFLREREANFDVDLWITRLCIVLSLVLLLSMGLLVYKVKSSRVAVAGSGRSRGRYHGSASSGGQFVANGPDESLETTASLTLASANGPDESLETTASLTLASANAHGSLGSAKAPDVRTLARQVVAEESKVRLKLGSQVNVAQSRARQRFNERQAKKRKDQPFGPRIRKKEAKAWLKDASLRDINVDVVEPYRTEMVRGKPFPKLSKADREAEQDLLSNLGQRGIIVHDQGGSGNANVNARWSTEPVVSDKYSVLINTFKGRDKQAAYLLRRYAHCDLLDRVVLLWNDFKRPIPPILAHMLLDLDGKARVVVQRTTNLTNRFRPQPAIRTDVIFSTDEDVVYECPLLDYGFQVVQHYPEHMVGFAPRKVLENREAYGYDWLSPTRRGSYNTVWATKGGFLRRALFDLYSSNRVFAEVRDLVNERVTAEDYLMSITHAYFVGPGKSKAIMVPRGAFRNLNISSSLHDTTSQYREEVGVLIRQTLANLGREFLMAEAYVTRWCEPYELPAPCNREGSHELFQDVYDWTKWSEVPNSNKSFVQV